MIADGSIGDHAKKTEKEDGESSFLFCFGCRAAKIRAEMKEQQEQDGNRREEFIMQLSEQAKQFRGDGYELMRTFRKWEARTILSSAAAALVISILICRLLT